MQFNSPIHTVTFVLAITFPKNQKTGSKGSIEETAIQNPSCLNIGWLDNIAIVSARKILDPFLKI